MNILKVIHGYPPLYNGGSEVYSQLLCLELAKQGHMVHVFTRQENPFADDYQISNAQDHINPNITLHRINIPGEKHRYRYIHPEIDKAFASLVDTLQPDVVHIGHLNHLSTGVIKIAHQRGLPIVYTLHDYWLMCPRGQFMQRNPPKPQTLWDVCDGQEHKKCATHCYAGYFSGQQQTQARDEDYWTRWVEARMAHIQTQSQYVDLFIAPAQYLFQRYIRDFDLPASKMVYLDYGFDLQRLQGRKRTAKQPFTFGYIGTHIPAKGIQHLISAFAHVQGDCELHIWGRYRAQNTDGLKAIAIQLPAAIQKRIHWHPEYANEHIVADVFNHVDCIVVPSIWVENSPLVIHEALQARIPVITADVGGMAEYVHHERNGLLFKHRNIEDLARQMQRLQADPALAKKLGERGYLQSENGDILSIQTHVQTLLDWYQQHSHTKTKPIPKSSGPWRITFDTNPDDCNLSCIMCEDHSPYSHTRKERVSQGLPRRRMDIALIHKLMREASQLGVREIIPSTMGEPLIYKDFEQIIQLCHDYEVKLNLTTNGTFPRKGATAWAKLLVPITSDVKISWNGSSKKTQEAIMLGTDWDKVLLNLHEFIAVRDEHAAAGGHYCRVTLQLTFLETNVHELANTVKLGINYGVDRIKGHHLWAHFDEIKQLSMRKDKETIIRWNTAVREAQAIADTHPLANGKKILLENIYELDTEHGDKDLIPGGQCPFLGKEAWVATDGRFNPCCAPDKLRRTLGEFGNLNEQSLEEIWQGEAYQRLCQDYMYHAVCKACNMRKIEES